MTSQDSAVSRAENEKDLGSTVEAALPEAVSSASGGSSSAASQRPARYFHGGAPGLRRGDLVSPRPADDQRHLIDGCPVCEARRTGTPSDYDRNHNFAAVYVTTERWNAIMFACGYPDGALYRVDPIGELTEDPEQPPNAVEAVNFAVASARVIAVLDPLVRLAPKDVRRLMRKSGVTERDVMGALHA